MKQKLHSTLKRAMFFKALVVMLFAFAFATTGYAQTSGTWGGIDWTLDTEGTLTIAPTTGTPTTDNSGKWSYEVGQWPEAVTYKSNGAASAIAGWPYDRTKVKKLIIEEGVTSIGSFAAQSMTNLTGEVVIPWTVNYIGQEAFQKSTMTKLTFQKVPEGETGGALCIAQGAFKQTIIEEISFPDDRPVELHAWLMLNSTKLKNITLPSTVTFRGTDHVDYNHKPTAQTGGNANSGQIVNATNTSLQSITFGSEEVKNLFLNRDHAAVKSDLVFIGLTGYSKKKFGPLTTIIDGDSNEFAQEEDKSLNIVNYKRTLLSVGKWNALYLPFELPMSVLGDDYDVAYYNNMHARDRDNNGTIESMEMELVLIKEGTLHAHHPYFIRAKNNDAVDMDLYVFGTPMFRTLPKITYEEVEVEDSTPEGDGESTEGEGGATEGEGESTEGEGSTTTTVTVEKVEPVNHTVITTSSAYLDYTLAGTYNTEADVEDFEAMSGTKYAIASDGSWAKTNAPAPFRVYLTIAERPDSPMKIEAQALARVRIRVAGEDATSIDEVEMPISAQPTVVYDLQGRRVLNTEGLKGVYIVNGKKVAF